MTRRSIRLAVLGALLLSWQGIAHAGPSPASPSPRAALPVERDLLLMGTTDVHGHVYPTTYYSDREEALGLAKLSTLIDRLRRENPSHVLVDSGDMLQGSPLPYVHARVERGKGPNPMIASMNVMRYDVFGVGNHDFNFGLDHLQAARREAMFPFVSCNIFRAGTETPYFKPYVMIDIQGVKVGVIGFSPPGIVLWDRAHVEGKLEVRDLLTCARRYIPRMKREGADVILAVPHSGLGGKFGPAYSGYSASSGLPPENVGIELAKAFPQIDVIFAGHSHQEVSGEIVNGVACAQAKLWGYRLAVARLKLKRDHGRWKVVRKSTETLGTEGLEPSKAVLQAIAPQHDRTLAYVHSPIARTSAPWSAAESLLRETPLVGLVHAVQLEATGAQLSSAASFNTEVTWKSGPITIADVASMYPYENQLVAIQITGKILRSYLEHAAEFYQGVENGQVTFNPAVRVYNYDMVAGVQYAIDPTRALGDRVLNLMVQGRPVQDTDTFRMAVNSYRQGGGGGYDMLKGCPVIYDRQQSIRELVIEYLQKKGQIEPENVLRADWSLSLPR